MDTLSEYQQQPNPDKQQKSRAWQTAIGLQKVDGLSTSDYLVETARADIEGRITLDEARQQLYQYYDERDLHTTSADDTREADIVSLHIRELLAEQTFSFTLARLTAIHRRLFNGVFKFAGQLRDYNITKREWALQGDTVFYVAAQELRQAIEYDLQCERDFDYSRVDTDTMVRHIANFISGLWQIHPFGEGNTRTIAVFTIKYLRSLGFDADNDAFADNAWFFRNALVRANYQNLRRGIARFPQPLEEFFRYLMLGEPCNLQSRRLLVNATQQ